MNPTANGRISWERVGSCTSDLDEEDERWHSWLNEVTTLNCNMMTQSLSCIIAQAQDLPTYDGLKMVDDFLGRFESAVLEPQQFDALKWALLVTHA